jgi:predicted RNase H-like HicB family nuclease
MAVAGVREIRLTVEFEEEPETNRWIAEVPEIPGCLVYGATREEAEKRAVTLALRVVAERVEHGEMPAEPFQLTF